MTDGTEDSNPSLVAIIASLLLAIAIVAGWSSPAREFISACPPRRVRPWRSIAAARRRFVVVRNRVVNATLRSPLELYHFDLAAARANLKRRRDRPNSLTIFSGDGCADLTPVKAEVSPEGIAVAMLSVGDWWLHASATLDTGERIEWRLPIAVSDRDQAVELSFENAYERTKEF
jgi:hypothetical protein